ncbi:MAG: tripartite tricarboxylate transporter substrate binding protein [Rhizobiales bacterium]|nr:tripartite tricarboxylate transporter substrate binding protein [Hyphomicrobiales bacterium]
MIFKLFKNLATLASLVALSTFANAQDWKPSGPITLQVGFGAGGSTDTLARVIGKSLEAQTGWDIIVENKPGGGGVAMFSVLATQKPDGHKLGIGVNLPILMQLSLRGDKIPFKADDFDYLATIATAPLSIIANADAPYNSFKEYIEYVKKNGKGKVGFDAGPQKFLIMAAANKSGVKLSLISHKSAAEIMQSILGGHVDIGFSAGTHIKYLESGKIKLLAVATNDRHSYAPDVETMVEQGFGNSVEPFFILLLQKAMPMTLKPLWLRCWLMH